ncbi:superfamily II DNA/RNA helicase [Stackebrandtia albiflava]|uniref:Superfamily II DNA/RNA helicase n=2 Tax=Stackebrandtia albiflava TaxID=406432 RepID=A0A562VEM9_9ACTN|nr:superfamily II DNA/RNA helicase [Stackebrandtia albiflava]
MPESTEQAVPGFAELGLPASIVAELGRRGVTTPFPIQAATIPDALAGKDVLGRGRTGSGKTLSFGLPLLVGLAADGESSEAKRPRGLILTPTRELAMQVADALDPYANILGLEMKVVCGGTSMSRQIDALKQGVDVLVATPGRLRDLIDRRFCFLDRVSVAVLDEADQMADMGFLPEVTAILDLIPSGGQRMLFSATLEREIDTLVKRYLDKPVTHEVDPSAGAVTTMSHHVLVVKPNTKAPVTAAIAGRKGRTIVFVRTQMGADRVAAQLRQAGVRAAALHGGMTQQARTGVLDDFKDGEVDALVATDVAARGIHVDGIDLVMNVDPARDGKDYLHRAGRTARAGRSGIVVTLALPHQRKTVFGMLERVDVDVSRHLVTGAFDEELVRITGARSLTDMEADTVAREAEAAQVEADALLAQSEALAAKAARLHGEAARLRDRAEKERSGLIEPEQPRPYRDRPPRERHGGGKPYRGQGGGPRHDDRDRRHQRDDRGRGNGRFDDRPRGGRRDDSRGGRWEDRGERRFGDRGRHDRSEQRARSGWRDRRD